MSSQELARITITKTIDEDDVYVFIDASCVDGEDLALVEALGMIELGKDTLIRQSMGDYGPDESDE